MAGEELAQLAEALDVDVNLFVVHLLDAPFEVMPCAAQFQPLAPQRDPESLVGRVGEREAVRRMDDKLGPWGQYRFERR